MLESVLSKCIMHYLKEYLLPIEPNQMKLKVFKGKIKLLNLQILPTALAVHHIPFIVRKGTIKMIKAIFPWKNMNAEATQVYIEDIYLVLQFDSGIIIKSDMQADQKALHIGSEMNAATNEEKKNTLQGLFETVIDNLKVSIHNIHVRIEFPSEPNPICIGLILPNISIQTVDEDNKLIQTIQHALFVRKQILISNFSIYFDTLSEQISLNNFNETMFKAMTTDHQYLFKPTIMESILIHTKDKTQLVTNKIETKIKSIELCLDFHQCRSVIQLNTIFTQFAKKRKYVNCNRPKTFGNSVETWNYAHKCGIVKITPHVFKPKLALAILKNRLKYIELYKQAKVSKYSVALLGSPKQKLDALEKKVGTDATMYLRELAEAIFIKEMSLKESSEITAFDLSELKSIFESTEMVFSMRQLSASLNIKSFSLELLYVQGTPLFVVDLNNLNAVMNSYQNGVFMAVQIFDASMVSYINDVSRNIFETIHRNATNNFFVLNLSVPTTDEVSDLESTIAPCKITLDTETMNNILEFFTVQNKKKLNIDEKKIRTVLLDIGEQLQGFKILKNLKMSIKMEQMSYDFPFKSGDVVKYLTIDLSNLTFIKPLEKLISNNAAEIPMNFHVVLNLKTKIDTITLLTSDDIKSDIQLILFNGKFGVDLNAKVYLQTLHVYIVQESYDIIMIAVKHMLAIPFMQSGVMANSTQQVLIAGRSKMGCEFELTELNIFLNDNIKENEFKVTIGDLNGFLQYFVSSFQFSAVLKKMKIEQFNQIFLEILGKVDVKMDKRSDLDPLFIDAEVIKPHGYMNFDTIEWVMAFSNKLIGFFPKSAEPIEAPKLMVRSTSNDESPKLYLTPSILASSVDSFINESGNIEVFVPRKRNRVSSILLDSSNDENTDTADLDFSDESNSVRLNLNVQSVLFEMIDESENGKFEIESVTISDPTSAGFILTLTQFSIRRANRYILRPVDLDIPVYLPEPIKVSIDYAESELFYGDINSLNVNSPRIFKLMFGGSEPLFNSTIEVQAFAKKGLGYLIQENHETIAKASIHDVNLLIKITPTSLIVEVKTGGIDGVYPDEFSFFNVEEDFYSRYIGTMKDQDIFISVPIADVSLRPDLFLWVIGFIPPPPDESTLQPLKITLDMKPMCIKFFNEIEDKNAKTLEVLVGESTCEAFRHNTLDLDMSVNGIVINSDVFDNRKLFGVSSIQFIMNENMMKARLSPLEVNLSLAFITKMVGELSSLISFPENQTINIDSVALSNIGIDAEIEKISVSLFTCPTTALQLEVPNFKFVMNSYYKIAGLSIGSVCLSTVVCMSEQELALQLSEIEAIVTFSDKNKFDLSTITLESISKLPQSGTDKRSLESIYFRFKMSSVLVNYTHLLANTLIDCFLNESIQQLKMPLDIGELTKNLNIGIHINCEIGKILFFFIILDPFASVICTGIKLEIEDKCTVSVNNLDVVSIENENCGDNNDINNNNNRSYEFIGKKKMERSLLIKKTNEDLLSITITSGECYAILSRAEFYIDYTLLLNLTKFLLSTPFLKLMSTKKSSDLVSFSTALPFTLIFNVVELDISIPTSLEMEGCPELQVHLSALLEVDPSLFSINVNSLSMNFRNVFKESVFLPILSEVAICFTMKMEGDSSFSFKANILEILLTVSVFDLYLFNQIANIISSTLNSIMFAFEESPTSNQLKISNFEIISSKITFILSKDNRSTSAFTPIFRCVIPPVILKVKKSDNSKKPVEIEFNPYVEYFNGLTGNYDMVIEPLDMVISTGITESQMKIGVKCNSDMNINIPLRAIFEIQNLVRELKESDFQQSSKFVDLPSMWISNNLGESVNFTIGEVEFCLNSDRYLPIFNVSMNSLINFAIGGKNYSIIPSTFCYPTYLSDSICVIKQPYKGGLLIKFEMCFQIENKLSFPLEMFVFDKKSGKYVLASKIDPGKRQPVRQFGKEIEIVLSGVNAPLNSKRTPLKLSTNDKTTLAFSIACKDRCVKCIKTVYNDSSIAARIVAINAAYVVTNLLPMPLYIRSSDKDRTVFLRRGESKDIDFIDNYEIYFKGYFSFEKEKFTKCCSSIKIDFKGPKPISVYNPEIKDEEKCIIFFDYEKETLQTSIKLYFPVVLFNMTTFLLKFKNNTESIEVHPNSHRNWCPSSVFESSADSLMASVIAIGNSKCGSELFDCYTSGHSTLLLKSLEEKSDLLFVPLRYSVSNHNQTSIMTFSPLLTVINNLSFDFALQPILNIPTDISNFSTLNGFSDICEKIGTPLNFASHSECVVPYIAKNGTFAINVKGYITNPALSLFEQQKTVFRVQNQKKYVLIELRVIDIGVGIKAEFNPVTFPTPIMINNQLDNDVIMAFQLVCLTPFEIEPNTTSIFAFDEPFSYPAVTLSFGAMNVYHISLVEDTERIEMKTKDQHDNRPVYIQVKHNINGNRIVIVSHEKEEENSRFDYIFKSSIIGIVASIIDTEMREVALVKLSNLMAKCVMNDEFLSIEFNMKNFQVDDQNPLAPMPAIIYGRNTSDIPFLSIECLCPADTELFSCFDFLSINIQRLDIDVDCSFISDWINIGMSLAPNIVHKIKPKIPTSGESGLVTFRWLEITPPYFVLSYHRKTRRPPLIGKIPYYFRFIPKIKAGKVLLPGVVITQLTDRIVSIANKLMNDYKSAAFNQILQMFGSGGKLLRGLGIASHIASALSIPLTCDMTNEISTFSIQESIKDDFDNRRERNGYFSSQTLSMLVKKLKEHRMTITPLIQKTLNKEDAGLRIKMIPGFGYGRGIAGMMTKAMNDTMRKVAPMAGVERQRNPRPFPGYRISIFEPKLANAQNIIYKVGGLNEKVKVLSVCSDSKKYILMTENSVYLFTPDLEKLLSMFKINEVKSYEEKKGNLLAINLQNGKTLTVVIESPNAQNFFFSQLLMTRKFQESLLL